MHRDYNNLFSHLCCFFVSKDLLSTCQSFCECMSRMCLKIFLSFRHLRHLIWIFEFYVIFSNLHCSRNTQYLVLKMDSKRKLWWSLLLIVYYFFQSSCLLSAAITACVITDTRVHCAMSGSFVIQDLYDFGWRRAKLFIVVPCLSAGASQNQNEFSANSTTKEWEHHTKLLSSRLTYWNSTNI